MEELLTYSQVLGRVDTINAPGSSPSANRNLIQNALNDSSPGDTVRLYPESVYEVDQGGTMITPSHGANLYPYCIVIPDGVILDLNGSTILRTAGLVANVIRAELGATDIGLVGHGTIDGNGTTSVLAQSGSGYLVWFDGISGITLDVKAYNGDQAGLVLEDCSRITAPYIFVDLIPGLGVSIGNGLATVTDSWFGYLEVRRVTQWPANNFNFPGNPIIGAAISTRIDTLRCFDNEAGVKVAEVSEDWTFGSVYIEGGTTTNSGLKYQGTGTGTPKRCHTEHLHCVDNGGTGLYMEQCEDCSVGSYKAKGNTILAGFPDVWIGGTRDKVGQIDIDSPVAATSCVNIRATAVDYQLGNISLRNPVVVANGITDSGGTGTITSLLAVDDQGTPKMDRGYRSNAAATTCYIENLEVRGATVLPFQRFAGDRVSVGNFRSVAGTNLKTATVATDAAFTLTPGSSARTIYHTGVLTGNRLVTLYNTLIPTPSGFTFTIVRTGAGAFNLDIGGLKNLTTGQWCEVGYDDVTALWKLNRFGSL